MTGSANWKSRAACLGSDTNVFFPHTESVPPEAAGICRGCPVRQPCLNYSLADSDLRGIWAGTSERERTRLRKLRRKAS